MRRTMFRGLAVLTSSAAAVLVCGFGQASAAPADPTGVPSASAAVDNHGIHLGSSANIGLHTGATIGAGVDAGVGANVDTDAGVGIEIGLGIQIDLGIGLTIGCDDDDTTPGPGH